MTRASVPWLAAVVVFAVMIAEAARARRNDRALRADGAREPRGDVYQVMQIAYPACFAAMLAEGAWRAVAPDTVFAVGGAIFAAAKALKYWAIASLGSRWTFRVLVPPGSERLRRGPYQWIAHPNYIAVAGELIGVAVAMHAMVTGPAAVVGFCLLMARRVVVEETALAEGTFRRRPGLPREE
jgi:methyltransferase